MYFKSIMGYDMIVIILNLIEFLDKEFRATICDLIYTNNLQMLASWAPA